MQRHVPEFGCAPKDDVLGQPGQVDGDHRQHEGRLGGEVAGRGRVDRIVGRSFEAEFVGDRIGI